MSEITGHNHYVPKRYFEPWAQPDGRVWSYRTLVPDEKYPVWRIRHPRMLAAHTHLYTSAASGVDSDEFERWLNQNIENPAALVLTKLTEDKRLTGGDWKCLAYYAAALDIRTPASFLELRARWERVLPGIMERSLKRLRRRLEEASAKGEVLAPRRKSVSSREMPVRVSISPSDSTEEVEVRAEVTLGRSLWLYEMHRLLTGIAQVLAGHRWSILRPHQGCQWFTSDHPVIRLNYYEPGRYDFRGGWGSPGTEIVLPLSPEHLMYTKIGSMEEVEATLSAKDTLSFQRLIAERAHRWIIARGRPRRAEWFRPRVVDRDVFLAEEEAWKRWHEEQSASERQSITLLDK